MRQCLSRSFGLLFSGCLLQSLIGNIADFLARDLDVIHTILVPILVCLVRLQWIAPPTPGLGRLRNITYQFVQAITALLLLFFEMVFSFPFWTWENSWILATLVGMFVGGTLLAERLNQVPLPGSEAEDGHGRFPQPESSFAR